MENADRMYERKTRPPHATSKRSCSSNSLKPQQRWRIVHTKKSADWQKKEDPALIRIGLNIVGIMSTAKHFRKAQEREFFAHHMLLHAAGRQIEEAEGSEVGRFNKEVRKRVRPLIIPANRLKGARITWAPPMI